MGKNTLLDLSKLLQKDKGDDGGQPTDKKDTKIQLQTSSVDEFENTIQMRIDKMRNELKKGFNKQFTYNKIKIISSDHVKQLLSQSRTKQVDVKEFFQKKPSIEESIS